MTKSPRYRGLMIPCTFRNLRLAMRASGRSKPPAASCRWSRWPCRGSTVCSPRSSCGRLLST